MMKMLIKVRPGSKIEVLQKSSSGDWVAFVRPKPEDGKANDALIRLVADYFGVPKTDINIKTGQSSEIKLLEIAGINDE